MLALLIMERPVSMHPDDIRDEKTKAIRSMRVLKAEDVVIGQYTAKGDKPGYKDDDGVPQDSNAPTYSVCRIMCDNERWEGVPMLIKAGKAMNETKMEVRVQFRSQPGFFGEAPEGFRNEFVMQLKPKDAMYMKMAMKKPGLDMQTMMSELNLTYKERCAVLLHAWSREGTWNEVVLPCPKHGGSVLNRWASEAVCALGYHAAHHKSGASFSSAVPVQRVDRRSAKLVVFCYRSMQSTRVPNGASMLWMHVCCVHVWVVAWFGRRQSVVVWTCEWNNGREMLQV